MTEVEVKILEIDPHVIEKKLIELGAKKTFEGDMLAYHFDFEDGSINQARDTLRLRKEGEKTTFTFKKHVHSDEAKIKEEMEVEVSDFETMLSILKNLGLQVEHITSKKRIEYSFGDAKIVIDKLTGEHEKVPAYLEIETEDVKILHVYVQKLGFPKQQCKNWTQEDVIEYYETKHV